MTVALVRHAQYHQPDDVPSALLPYGLTPEGVLQAEHCAHLLIEFLEDSQLDCVTRIDCSLMLRAWQTARVIVQTLESHLDGEFRVQEHPQLAERSLGAVANLTISEIELILVGDPRYSKPEDGWKSDHHYRLPFQGAESLNEAGLRVAHYIEALSYKENELKVIVGHGASMRHAAVHLGILDENEVSGLSMDHASPVYIKRNQAGDWTKIDGQWKPRILDGRNSGD